MHRVLALGVDVATGLAATTEIARAAVLVVTKQADGLPPIALCTAAGVPDAACATASPALDAGNPAAPGSGGGACEASDERGQALFALWTLLG